MAEGENHSQFYLDDDQILSHAESNHNEFESSADDQNDPENIANMVEFDSKLVFTPKPQPILGLMGMRASKIVCG